MAKEAAGADVREIIDFASRHLPVTPLNLEHGGLTVPVLSVPNGSGRAVMSVKKFLDEYRLAPERRRGISTHGDLPSFIEHVNRFKDADSALFATPLRRDEQGRLTRPPSLTAVLNYHRIGAAGAPQFGDHRSVYDCPLSEEWRDWARCDGEKMSQQDFAEFIEDRIADVVAPPVGAPTLAGGENVLATEDDARLLDAAKLLNGVFAGPSKLMELARGMAVTVNERVKQAVNLQTGEIAVQYETQHGEAGQKVQVPNLFLIAIPVFELGSLYRMIVRLRYRAGNSGIAWFFQLYRPEKVFDHAFKEVAETARAGTELPLFYGAPEAEPAKPAAG
jgi:uncharacterized protein YfdQ (DUF2303 family)